MNRSGRRIVGNAFSATVALVIAGLVFFMMTTSSPSSESAIIKGFGSQHITAGPAPGTAKSVSGASLPGNSRSFSISGGVSGLFPGASLPLSLRVDNLQSNPIILSSITTTVLSSQPSCSSKNVAVATFSGKVMVNPRQSVDVTVVVTMLHGAPNACQGAQFVFDYVGTGREK